MIIPKDSDNYQPPQPITIQVPDSVAMALQQAALELQTWLEQNRSEHYRHTDLVDVVRNWFELEIETLAQEAVYHCVSGSSTHAIGRRTFQQLLEKLPYAASPEDIDQLYQDTSAPVSTENPNQAAA